MAGYEEVQVNHYNLWEDPDHPEVWYCDDSGQWFGKGHLTAEYFHERAIELDGNLDDPDLFCRVKHAWATNEQDSHFDYTTTKDEEYCNPVTLGEFPSFFND